MAEVGLSRRGWAEGVREEVLGWMCFFFCVVCICGVNCEGAVGEVVKNSTGSDNTLTVGPSYVCVYKNAIITKIS